MQVVSLEYESGPTHDFTAKELSPMKATDSRARSTTTSILLLMLIVTYLAVPVRAQVDSGSDGSDGVFHPTTNIVVDMTDHPDGIYQYSSVVIPSGVTVSFTRNAQNTPVVWLVQTTCTIEGTVAVRGMKIGEVTPGISGAPGGPGGFGGGSGVEDDETGTFGAGLGPGGGTVINGNSGNLGGSGSFGTKGNEDPSRTSQFPAGDVYGTRYLVPLIGGSGGGGGSGKTGGIYNGGGGGGGALLIASDQEIVLNGSIDASGGGALTTSSTHYGGGGGSGGGVRLISTRVRGTGAISTQGGTAYYYWGGGRYGSTAGHGRIRIDALEDAYTGSLTGASARGFQPVVLLPAGQNITLTIESVAGTVMPQNPTGIPTDPDVVISAHQAQPVTIVVRCHNVPLGSEVVLDIKPSSGEVVRAVSLNSVGTEVSSTATFQVNMPRGTGTIQAKVVSGIADLYVSTPSSDWTSSLAQTGWLATGERFASVEIMSVLGGGQSVAYISASGKRYTLRN
ncbi:MAG: hypothetical protein HN341_05130 [Verrucomicrobia bacterium]|nr:hypothetical protein [Verrucomicrobiota bacterium]